MDSSGDSSSPSAMKISSSSTGASSSDVIGIDNDYNNRTSSNGNDYSHSIALPPAFVEDPSGFLTSIASRQSPSPDAISLLAGPLSKWFREAEELHCDSNSLRSTMTNTGPNPPVHPAVHVAQLYLRAAATQLREPQSQPETMGASGGVVAAAMAMQSTSIAHGIAASTGNVISREQLENKNQIARHRDETLEAVAASARLCSGRTAITSSGILPVLANLVAKSVSSNSVSQPGDSASFVKNKIASSITTSLPNLSSSSAKAFPPMTIAHTVFLQCAVLAEEYDFAETVIRGTWPLPTSLLKKKKGIASDSKNAAILIILRYYYLRGIIHYGCGSDHYYLAHRCWWTCLSIGDLANDIAMKAWKKLTLVQPLLDINPYGREGEPNKNEVSEMNIDSNFNIIYPDSSSASKNKNKVQRSTRLPKCARTLMDTKSLRNKLVDKGGREKDFYLVYTQLGPAVEAVDRPHAESLVVEYESVLAADGNMGMAQNCLQRVKELQVRTASKIFSVTSIQILARRWNVTLEQAYQQLSDSISLGVVPCRVEEDGTVVFSPQTGSEYNNTSTNLADLTGWMKLLERLQLMDINLAINSKYSNAVKQKDDKIIMSDAIGSVGPRGVEEFYGNPTI